MSSVVKSPLRVLITGAAGQIAYSLIPLIASGSVFGADQSIILHLLDIEPAKNVLQGVVMEIQDALFPLIHRVVATTNAQEAFTDIDCAVLLGGFPRKAGMTRADLMSRNNPIFVEQGRMLNNHASKNVKVLVVANPANTNCLVAASNAPDVPRTAFSALTRLDENRARAQLANKLGVNVKYVKNVVIWGNHSKTMVPDASGAKVVLEGKETPVSQLLQDGAWVRDEFVPTVQNRGTKVIEMRGLSSAMSAAQASADHLRDWFQGTAQGEYVSMGVWSTGAYNAPTDVVFSFPVTCKDREYSIVANAPVDDFTRNLLTVTGQELLAERAEATQAAQAQQ